MIKTTDQLYTLFKECSGVSIDTRNITPGCLFIALRGPNFNANEFAKEALDKGAKYALVDQPEYASAPNILEISDGLITLQELAKHHRRQLNIPVIGITGSNGKTTTKELISKVLGTTFNTFATRGNLNNHIGVPLTILSISQKVEIAIVEMGANHIGEIADLCEIAQPTHGLITNIGKAHIEGFGGFEGVIRGKSELYQYLIQHDREVFINSQDPILSNMSKRFSHPIFYPEKGDFLNVTYTGSNPYLNFIGERNIEIPTKLIGAYNFNNIAAALCIAKYFKVPTVSAEEAVAQYEPTNNRSQVLQKETNTIVLDAYNANPSSMNAALENFDQMEATNKVVILGDMMELGEESDQLHREIVATTKKGISKVLLCGSMMMKARDANPEASCFANRDELIDWLTRNPIKDSTILIKASRGIGLEEVLEYI